MSKKVDDNTQYHRFSPKKEKECMMCKKSFLGKSSNQKTCSSECSLEWGRQKQKAKYKRTYVKKGYNQKGENNNRLKKGQGSGRKYREYSPHRKDYCEYCNKTELKTKLTFVVHHKDGDHLNNHPDNLITLCHRCHKLVHNDKIVV
ncbi:MAG: HNH endonuclease signature motif containing protein [Fusobacteriaceae bacterium]